MKGKFDEEEQKKEAYFMQKIKEEELQEREILQLAHQTQLERSKTAADDALQSLSQQQQQKEQSLSETHKLNLQGLHNKYWKQVYSTTLIHQENYTKFIEHQQNELIDFIVKLQEEEDLLFSAELAEIEELCREQGRPESEKKDICAVIFSLHEQIKKQHSEQNRELLIVQKEELINLTIEQKLQRQEVKKNAPDNLLHQYSKKLKHFQRRKTEIDTLEEGPLPPAFVPAPPPDPNLISTNSLPARMSSSPNLKKEKSTPKKLTETEKLSRKSRSSNRDLTSSVPKVKKKKPVMITEENKEVDNIPDDSPMNSQQKGGVEIIFTPIELNESDL